LAGWARGHDVVALTAGGEALATWLGVTATPLPAGLALLDAGSLATAARVAKEAGATWLALPLAARHEGDTPQAADPQGGDLPLALRLAGLEAGLLAWGLPPLVAPLLRRGWRELGRLALAYEVPFELTRDCPLACGACPACKGRAQALAAAGLPR
jgi:hypothetical protein